MPDENAEVVEHDEVSLDEEAEDSFNDDDPVAEQKTDDPPEVDPAEKTPEKEPEVKPEEKPEAEKTVLDEINERIPDAPEEEEPEKKPPEKPEEKPIQKTTPVKLTKENIAYLVGAVSVDELPDGDVFFGDEQVNPRQWAEDDPEGFQNAKIVGGFAAHKMINAAIRQGTLVTAQTFQKVQDDATKRIDQLEGMLVGMNYWNELGAMHPDAKELSKSDEFHAWLKAQPKKIQDLSLSMDPTDGDLVIRYYKEGVAKKKTKEFDDKANKAKKKKDDLLSHTMRTEQRPTREAGVGDEEAERAFNEE